MAVLPFRHSSKMHSGDSQSDLELDRLDRLEIGQRINKIQIQVDHRPSTSKDLTPIKCLCFNLTKLSPLTRFVVLTIGVNFFFLLNSSVEEYIFKSMQNFTFGWFLTWFELMCFTSFALIERLLLRNESLLAHRASLNRHLLVAGAMTLSRGLTNVSLQYLNYPTQIIFKSMKLLTVMAGSLLMLNIKFRWDEYFSAFLLVISACLFSLGDIDVEPNYSLIGVFIVVCSLVADAVHSNTQEALLRLHQASTSEAMLFTNLFAAGLTFLYVFASGELVPALEYCNADPRIYWLFLCRSLVIYGGVLCFVTLIKSSGVVVATTITTLRKILSIVLSFALYPKTFSIKYASGMAVFVASVFIGVWGKDRNNKLKQLNQLKDSQKPTRKEYMALPIGPEDGRPNQSCERP